MSAGTWRMNHLLEWRNDRYGDQTASIFCACFPLPFSFFVTVVDWEGVSSSTDSDWLLAPSLIIRPDKWPTPKLPKIDRGPFMHYPFCRWRRNWPKLELLDSTIIFTPSSFVGWFLCSSVTMHNGRGHIDWAAEGCRRCRKNASVFQQEGCAKWRTHGLLVVDSTLRIEW